MGRSKVCAQCGEGFAVQSGRGKAHARYCSGRCRGDAQRARYRSKNSSGIGDCAWCGERFEFNPTRGAARRYCTPECRKLATYSSRAAVVYPECEIEGCETASRTRNILLCEMHYGRMRRYGDVEPWGCPRCGKPQGEGKSNGSFCSRRCRLLVAKYSRYDLTIAEGLAFEERHGGKCAICGESGGTLSWDHCHDNGELRGLLCNLCNAGIGMMRDRPELLRAAAEYLS